MIDVTVVIRIMLTLLFFICIGYLPNIYRELKRKRVTEDQALIEMKKLNMYLKVATKDKFALEEELDNFKEIVRRCRDNHKEVK